uniref:Uncharacterized protein n=1 Tax=Arundo donax TaxID=35708 RepID=A0A0A9AIF6_ARUDO
MAPAGSRLSLHIRGIPSALKQVT